MKLTKLILPLLTIISTISCTEQNPNFDTLGNDVNIFGDTYNLVEENPFIPVDEKPISTFSIDADGASYANVRRFIDQDNRLPPRAAVRTEELINYFNLNYPYNDTAHPIHLNGEVSECLWDTEHKLIRIGLKGKPITEEELPPSNFVFLIDVSGSMASEDKLELLKTGFKQLAHQLKATDRIAIVTYAGASQVVLESTPGNNTTAIIEAIDRLGAGGSTAGAEGIITAYEIAQQNFIEGGNNRIIIGTDGDFNVGPSSQEELITLIEEKRDFGIFLTVLGVGRGNLNDAALEQIANNGNGTYEYIDTIEQLRKVFIYEKNKFFTVAKDVKIQVAFNPDNVIAYRLIGYENRLLNTEDFENDEEDAGEIGADQNITALYEIVPKINPDYKSVPTFTINSRYKNPDANSSIPLSLEIFDEGHTFEAATDFMKFTASIASFSMLIRNSQYKGTSSYNTILEWLSNIQLQDEHNFKTGFKNIVTKAKNL